MVRCDNFPQGKWKSFWLPPGKDFEIYFLQYWFNSQNFVTLLEIFHFSFSLPCFLPNFLKLSIRLHFYPKIIRKKTRKAEWKSSAFDRHPWLDKLAERKTSFYRSNKSIKTPGLLFMKKYRHKPNEIRFCQTTTTVDHQGQIVFFEATTNWDF